MIKKTNRYHAFKLLERNRRIYPRHLKDLIKSIEEDNRLEENPIIVNEKMEIIDGQHRLQAAKVLDIPVYYIVSNSADMDTVMRLQTQKRWSVEDYIDSHVKAGNENYIILKEFIRYYGLPVNVSAELLSGHKKKRSSGGSFGRVIKSGVFEVTTLKEAKDFAEMYREIYQRIRKPFASSRDFVIAVANTMACQNYSHAEMLRKLDHFAGRLEPQPSFLEYQRDLEMIFNLKRKGEVLRLY